MRPWTAVLAVVAGAAPAQARVLEVGPGRAYPLPSAAAADLKDGDSVDIAAGEYFDCAQLSASDLTISGPPVGPDGPKVLLTDRACLGKAALVISGARVTVRGIGFTRIRVPDGNGAGIRAEGPDLTVQDCHFVNNQVGILSSAGSGALRIVGTSFIGNGSSVDGRPTHAVQAGALDLLRIEHSSFRNPRGGDHVVSAARRTDLLDNDFADESGRMSGPLVWVQGGALTLQRNSFRLDPGGADRPGAVLATGSSDGIVVRGNTLVGGQVSLLRNWTDRDAVAEANTVPVGTDAVSASGATYHRWRARLAALREGAKDLYRLGRHEAAEFARAWRLIH